jgi:hypothetical protein
MKTINFLINKKLLVLFGFLVPAFVKNYGGQAGAPLIGNAVICLKLI